MTKFVQENMLQLSHKAAIALLEAATLKAESLAVPQCIVIVDRSGVELASLRMDGAKILSLKTATAKAKTSASHNVATGNMPYEVGLMAAIATSGAVINLKGGLPIRFNGQLAGAIGVGSGTGEEDVLVAGAALAAIGADSIE